MSKYTAYLFSTTGNGCFVNWRHFCVLLGNAWRQYLVVEECISALLFLCIPTQAYCVCVSWSKVWRLCRFRLAFCEMLLKTHFVWEMQRGGRICSCVCHMCVLSLQSALSHKYANTAGHGRHIVWQCETGDLRRWTVFSLCLRVQCRLDANGKYFPIQESLFVAVFGHEYQIVGDSLENVAKWVCQVLCLRIDLVLMRVLQGNGWVLFSFHETSVACWKEIFEMLNECQKSQQVAFQSALSDSV